MCLLLEHEIVLCKPHEDLGTILDHQVIHRLWVAEGAPHDATELCSRLKEVSLTLPKDVLEET